MLRKKRVSFRKVSSKVRFLLYAGATRRILFYMELYFYAILKDVPPLGTPLPGEDYRIVWGSGFTACKSGTKVVVKKLETEGAPIYRVFAPHRNIFQLSEKFAQLHLTAVRQGGVLSPVSPGYLAQAADDWEYVQWQFSR